MSRKWLAPLSPLYGAAVAAKNAAYALRWMKPRRLRWPVISIGNLSVGGSGKTPLTIRLAELLSAEGVVVDVLSRGYGRTSKAVERVDPSGDPARYSDEPLLIARRTGRPVFLGASRYHAGLLAESQIASSVTPPEYGKRHIHLLDDGFQHRQLARDLDIVILHRSDFTETLLPAGRLREPLTALSRPDVVVLREEDVGFEEEVHRFAPGAPIWVMKRSLAIPEGLANSTTRVVAFCGIARPDEFFSSLTAKGVKPELTVAFADHHRYSREDAAELVRAGKKIQVEAFVTTEKDAVKLDTGLRSILEAIAPIRVVELKLELRDEIAVVRQILEKLPPG